MNPQNSSKLVCLVVLDGWGLAPPGPGNAISQAKTMNMDRFWAGFPHAELAASGEAVGLPRGEVGNTETGHLNLGAGRIVYQDLARINMAIADGSFYANSALTGAVEHAKKNKSSLHLMGLLGAGGVHSNLEHVFALIELCHKQQFNRVYLHLFTDGRDSPPTSAKIYVSQIREAIKKEGIGEIASIMGRYWAMDRDFRWERTQKAFLALTAGEGHLVKTPEEAIDMSYAQGRTDEFIEPAIISTAEGKPVALIKENDAVIFFNFRIDRPRQLSRAFVLEDFSQANFEIQFDPYLVKYTRSHISQEAATQKPFARGARLNNLYFVMMTEYGKHLVQNGAKVAFPPEAIKQPLGAVISEAGKLQLRCTESEKERFVTFYFNGQVENPFLGEERLIVPSPKIPTYDLKPEMAAKEITENTIITIKEMSEFKKHAFILVNFANPDMVGHTGSIGAVARACQVVDECVGELSRAVLSAGGTLLITADHGNAEEMINSHTGVIFTEHTGNPVPFIAIAKEFAGKPIKLADGILADVAPTVLSLLGIPKPEEMTGRNLLAEV